MPATFRAILRGADQPELRSAGGERGLEVPWADQESSGDLRAAFEARHRQRFGYVVEGEPLVVERLQVLLPAAGGGRERSAQPRASVLQQERSGAEETARASGAAAMGGVVRDAGMGVGGIRSRATEHRSHGGVEPLPGWRLRTTALPLGTALPPGRRWGPGRGWRTGLAPGALLAA